MTTSVWVKLYIGEDAENHTPVFGIHDFDGVNDQLKEKIKEKNSNVLKAVDAAQLNVYAPGTSYPIKEGQSILDPGDNVPTDTTSREPLIVVAPATLSVSFVLNKQLFIVGTPE